jgi:hypothetical protein
MTLKIKKVSDSHNIFVPLLAVIMLFVFIFSTPAAYSADVDGGARSSVDAGTYYSTSGDMGGGSVQENVTYMPDAGSVVRRDTKYVPQDASGHTYLRDCLAGVLGGLKRNTGERRSSSGVSNGATENSIKAAVNKCFEKPKPENERARLIAELEAKLSVLEGELHKLRSQLQRNNSTNVGGYRMLETPSRR